MVEISDSVSVDASLERVTDWLMRLPDHYVAWHPREHESLVVLSSPSTDHVLEPGSIARAVETIGPRRLDFRFRVCESDDPKAINWEALSPYRWISLRGSFSVQVQAGGGVRVTSILSYGWNVPVLGRVGDWLIDRFYLPRSAVRQHMAEEGRWLKKATEAKAH